MNKNIYRYLYALPQVRYNNQQPFYRLPPLKIASHLDIVVFAGKNMLERRGMPTQGKGSEQGEVYIYLETTQEITAKTRYKDLIVLTQIVSLTEQLLVQPEAIDISDCKDFKEVLSRHGSEHHSDPDMRFNPMGELHNSFEYLPHFTPAINNLDEDDLSKFLNGLYTFGLAKELERYPNPHLKHTLQVTLYVSVINQLANNVSPKCGGKLNCVCDECGEKVTLDHRGSSEMGEIRNLLDELFGEDNSEIKKLVINAYRKTRSGFLHSGRLAGMEMDGGTFEFDLEESREPIETLVNLQMLASRAIRNYVFVRTREADNG